MAQLLEWSPLIAFFAAYKLRDIYWGAAALMFFSVLVMLVHRLRTGKFKTMHVVIAAVAVVLGSATLFFHDQRFIQWKPTILMGISSVAFLGSSWIGKQPLARRLLESAFEEPLEVSARAWNTLNLIWAAWFAFLALLNIYVAHNFAENIWVYFKVFGLTVASVVFMVPQALWLSGKIKSPAAEQA